MKKNVVFLLLLGVMSGLFAQEVEILNLTIEKAVEIALENNISVKKSSIDLEKAKIADLKSFNESFFHDEGCPAEL